MPALPTLIAALLPAFTMVDRRLLALYATTTVLMMTYGLLGPFLPLLAAEKGVTSGQVGVISVSTLLGVWSFLLYWVCCCIDWAAGICYMWLLWSLQEPF